MPQAPETIYMDAVLTPNQSLSRRGFLIVMIGLSAISFSTGLAFYSIGALPVAGFFGADLLAMYLAFRWAFRAQKEHTQVKITTHTVHLLHTRKNGSTLSAEMPTAFTRVHLTPPAASPAIPHLHVESGGKSFIIGRFLAEDERLSLSEAMQQAILSARSERYPSH
ncbi:MAG: DUF2244 domain-containing protein [Hyphomonas sp.]